MPAESGTACWRASARPVNVAARRDRLVSLAGIVTTVPTTPGSDAKVRRQRRRPASPRARRRHRQPARIARPARDAHAERREYSADGLARRRLCRGRRARARMSVADAAMSENDVCAARGCVRTVRRRRAAYEQPSAVRRCDIATRPALRTRGRAEEPVDDRYPAVVIATPSRAARGSHDSVEQYRPGRLRASLMSFDHAGQRSITREQGP